MKRIVSIFVASFAIIVITCAQSHTIYIYKGGVKTEISGVDSVAFVNDKQKTDYGEIINNLIANMVNVEGGTFTMGATSEQGTGLESDEAPTHQVTLSSFQISKYEVTQREWEEVMGSNPSRFNTSAMLPVESVSWDDCKKFISKLNAITGQNFRLPTEAEWEYAARGGRKSKIYKFSGSNFIDDIAWYRDNSDNKTHPVGTKQPNELGLYDMTGNIGEWCQDWYNSYNSIAQTNPTGPVSSSTSSRVYRGNNWRSAASICHVSNRDYASPSFSSDKIGLRLAK